MAARASFLCALLLASHCAFAARIELPLRVSMDTLREALADKLVYPEGRCTQLRLQAADGRLKLAAQCESVVGLRGNAEFILAPQVDAAGRLGVRVVDSRLVDAQARALAVMWDLAKRQVHPRIEQYRYDLAAPRRDLSALLRSATPPQHAAQMERALESLQVLDPRVEAAHVVVPVAFEAPDAWTAAPAPPAAAAPLTEAELAALEKALEPLDAFLVHSIRSIARERADPALRKRLFTLLLDTRYALVAVLAGDAPSADPVRSLFFDAWRELRAILEEAGLRHAVFVDAGDALLALERAAPGLGVHLSAEGLRQLARSLAPAGSGADPLAYEWDDDPELRRLFDVEEIPPPPPGTSSLGAFIRAAEGAARPLDRWVPSRDELPEYEKRIGELLKNAAVAELARTALEPAYRPVYMHLVPTTALIESCWRQYVVRGGKATYLRSQAGSVGIMQINQVVWRGFYDVQRLRWDTAYNVRAGTQILMRYVKDYAIPYAQKSGEPAHVPRAAYAVYNAGPRAAGRFDKPKPHPREARVDGKLRELYQGIASGRHADLRTCGVRPATGDPAG